MKPPFFSVFLPEFCIFDMKVLESTIYNMDIVQRVKPILYFAVVFCAYITISRTAKLISRTEDIKKYSGFVKKLDPKNRVCRRPDH